jgi:hypothetical protein
MKSGSGFYYNEFYLNFSIAFDHSIHRTIFFLGKFEDLRYIFTGGIGRFKLGE